MALSGSVSTSSYDGRYCELEWTATQSISDNTSTISWTLSAKGGSSSWYTDRTIYVNIDGDQVYSKTAAVDRYKGTIASGTKTLTHNSDGSRSFSVSLGAAIYYSSVNCTGSQTFTLNTIARASGLSVSDGTLGSAQTITASRNSSAFTHTLTWKCGSYSGTIATKSSATSWSFTPELKLAEGAPNGTKVYCGFTLTTYNGTTSIGSVEKAVWLTIPESVVPTCSLLLSDANGYLATYGGYIQGRSVLHVVVNASGAHSSKILSYSTSANGATNTSQEFNTTALTTSGSNTISTTVKDSRGRTASSSQVIQVIPYSNPKITSLSVHRCDEDGTENDRGSYAKVSLSYTVTSLSNQNTNSAILKYKKSSESDWTSVAIEPTSYEMNYSTIIAADEGNAYQIGCEVTDAFSTSALFTSLSTGFCLYHVPASGKGITFGGIAEGDGFNVKMDSHFSGDYNTFGGEAEPIDGTDHANGMYVKQSTLFTEPVIFGNSESSIPSQSSDKIAFERAAHFGNGLTEDIRVYGSADCNNLVISGNYYVGNNATNKPSTANGWLTVKSYSDGSYCTQDFVGVDGGKYFRMRQNGTWGGWRQTSSADIVLEQGTLTNSSGTWTYRKWRSGLAECWILLDIGTPYNHPGWNEYWAYLPLTFSDTDYGIQMTSAWNPQELDHYGPVNSNGGWKKTAEKFVFSFYYNNSTAYSIRFYMYVAGRWK